MTQEFHISVTPVGNDEYLVRTERVAPGVPLAEEQVVWKVDDWLAQARQLMNDPLVGLLQGENTSPLYAQTLASGAGESDLNQPPLSFVELGQQLYGALFQGTLRDSWVTAQGIAQHRNEALRLRLGLKGTRLPRLPWEVLYGNDTPTERSRGAGLGPVPRPLATGTHVMFSRYQPNAQLAAGSLATVAEPNQPLRVLMVIAAPTDRERLELEREANHLQQELRSQTSHSPDGAGSLPDIQLTLLKQPGREQLTQALEQGRFQVLHYAGHSDLGAAGGSLYLVNNRTGLTEILSGDDLAGLLVNNGIRLAVFNSCRGACTATSGPEQGRNLAEALVSRGIPAVLAMAEQIPDNVALTLTWLFYRNLKLGYPIDLSLSRARQGLLSAYGSHQLYWALPILYLHPDFDGYLIPGDRAHHNPADRLILVPQGYGALPILTTEEVVTPISPLSGLQPSGLHPSNTPGQKVAQQSVMTDMTDLGDMTEDEAIAWTEDLNDLDESYEEDVSLVADLLRQLTPPTEAADPSIATPSGSGASPAAPAKQTTGHQHASQPASTDPSQGHDQNGNDENDYKPAVGSPMAAIPGGSSVAISATAASRRRHRSRQRQVLPILGVIGAVGVALVGIWSLSRFQEGTILQFPGDDILSLGGTPDLQTADPEQVKSIAIDYFRRKDFARGEQAVMVLLDRGALKDAAEALATVPTQVDTPGINYLWGRLAWQGRETGNPVYSLQDARRYWEMAAKAAPDNPQYQEALGFAYYTEGKPLRAMQAWVQALSILENRPDNQSETQPESQLSSAPSAATVDVPDATLAQTEMEHDILTTYAGIALALWRSSVTQPPAEQENLIRKAAKIYQMVQRRDPNSFQPEVLRRDWRWSDGAIRDWQALSQIQP